MTPLDDDSLLSRSTQIGRRDYGVKIARKYFDANTAPDEGILFNSSYPMLQMAYLVSDVTELPHTEEETYIDVTNPNTGVTTRFYTGYQFTYVLEHNLGYVPLIINLSEATGTSDVHSALSGEWEGYSCSVFGVTRKRAYFRARLALDNEHPTDAQKAKIQQYAKQFIRMLITQVGIRHDVEYPYLFASQEITADEIPSDYGIKTLLDGADVSTEDQYVIGMNLNLFPQLVLAVKTEETISENWAAMGDNRATLYQVPEQINYDPMFLCFKCTSKDDYGDDLFEPDDVAARGAVGYRYFTGTRRIYQSTVYDDPTAISGFSYGKISMVVLRMPILSAQSQEISV